MIPNISSVSISPKIESTDPNSYTVTDNNGIVYYVPCDPKNADYQLVIQWILAGNTPTS